MSTSTLFRWSGMAAILGGLFLIPGSISFEPPWSSVGMLGSLLLVFGVTGIYLVQTSQSGITGFLGFLFTIPGSVFLTAGSGNFAGVEFWMLGSMLSAVGIILLAIGTFSAEKFPRWVPWLWIGAVVAGLPSIFIPSLALTLGIFGSILAAIGMAGAGYMLWSGKVH